MTRARLLLVFRDPGRIRYFESVLGELADRGHELHVVIEAPRERIPGQLAFITGLAERHAGVRLVPAPKSAAGPAPELAKQLRLALDHLHYQQPAFADSPHFRARAAEAAPAGVVALARRPALRRPLASALAAAERRLPADTGIDALVGELAPDAVIVTPYVWFGAPQTDWVRVARARGIRAGALLFSWDNLTSKGSVREAPDLLTVWNEEQRREASTLHGIPAERITVTGAQVWDHWFDWQPSLDRAAFAEATGLDAAAPVVLWLESSGYVGGESAYVRDWIGHVREVVPGLQILIRPHPQVDAAHWHESGIASMPGVAVWPARGEVPLDEASRQTFYDALHHSAAVVGVNTSSFIEAAIVGRPCLTTREPQFVRGQEQTIHFRHLQADNGGPLRVARSLPEHAAQLAGAIAAPDPDVARGRAFVERFVRPFGLDEPATPRVVEAIERLAASSEGVAQARRPLPQAALEPLRKVVART
jgi:hypothetical protein